MSEITLTQSGVNGGTAVIMYGATVTYSWKNIIKNSPIPQKFDTAEVDISGWENPEIIINGSFNVDDLDTNEIRHSLLMAFAKVQYDGTNPITLSVPTGNSATQTNLLAADGTTSSIRVLITDFRIIINTGSECGHVWDFTIEMVETK